MLRFPPVLEIARSAPPERDYARLRQLHRRRFGANAPWLVGYRWLARDGGAGHRAPARVGAAALPTVSRSRVGGAALVI
jgi:hypothetical protein